MATVTEAPIPATLDEEEAPPAGDVLYEVVDGQIVEVPEMGADETDLANELAHAMVAVARPGRLGKVEVEMLFLLDAASGLRRRPDVAFVTAARWPVTRRLPKNRAAWAVVPDLAVEVISETNRTRDDLAKVREYFAAGVRLVWLVVPGLELVYAYSSPTSVHVLTREDILDAGDILPGFALPLADFFGEPVGDDEAGEAE